MCDYEVLRGAIKNILAELMVQFYLILLCYIVLHAFFP